MGSSVLGVPYGARCTCGKWYVRGTLRSRVHVGSGVLELPYGAGYMWGVVC